MGTVLLRKGHLGDVVLLGAVTASLTPPVTVVTNTPWIGVAARLKGVSTVQKWSKYSSGCAGDTMIDLQGSRSSAQILSRHNGPKRAINKRSLQRRLRLFLDRGPSRPLVADIYAETCGVEQGALPWMANETEYDGSLAIVPCAHWRTKSWNVDSYRDLARNWSGIVRVFGGPGEEDWCDQVVRNLPETEVVVEAGFSDTVAKLGRAAVAVGGDTGLMHLAGALGVPVVTLFGPTHPDDGFFCYPGAVVQNKVRCRPCTLHGRRRCPLLHHRCMDHTVHEVFSAVRRVAR